MAEQRYSISFGPLTEEDLELRLGSRSADSSDLANEGRTINGMEDQSHGSNHVETMAEQRYSISFGPLTEEDLELRLGPRSADSSDLANEGRTINGMEDQSHGSNHIEKCTECSSSHQRRLVELEPRYICGICLDTLKEESSAKCGHVFCGPCITTAIQIQKRCPLCRMRMKLPSIRRIYLSQAST